MKFLCSKTVEQMDPQIPTVNPKFKIL